MEEADGGVTVENIIVAIITGGLALIGVIISNHGNNRRVEATIEKSQAVTETKLEELTREVREHNNFAKRMPVVEEQIKTIRNDVKTLKGYHQPTT